jgi:hypothetical protein
MIDGRDYQPDAVFPELASLSRLTADAARAARLRAACHARLTARARRETAPPRSRGEAAVSLAVFAFCGVYVLSLIDTALRVLF